MTFDPVKGQMTYTGWVMDQCDQDSLKSVKATRRYIRFNMWLTEGRKNRETEYRRIACACITRALCLQADTGIQAHLILMFAF